MTNIRDDAYKRIMDAARGEFFRKGYARASMRNIAFAARMTVGNIYQYFKGKEALFEAVVLEPVRQLDSLTGMTPPTDGALVEHLVLHLRDMFIQSRQPFMILISRAEGSRYEDIKERVVALAQQRLADILTGRGDARLSGPLAVSLIEGLLYLFEHYDGDEALLTRDLHHYLYHMLRGIVPSPDMEE